MTIEQLKSKFIEKYGEGEISGYFSPGRVNLIGEHTDYNGGFVLPCAIQYGTWLAMRETPDGLISLASANDPVAKFFFLRAQHRRIGEIRHRPADARGY